MYKYAHVTCAVVFLGDFPETSLAVEFQSNPEVPRKLPRFPRKFPRPPRKFPRPPRKSAPLSGKLTPYDDQKKVPLRQNGTTTNFGSLGAGDEEIRTPR